MQTTSKIIINALIGLFTSGMVGFLNFFALMQSGNSKFADSVGFSLIAGMCCAFAGFFIGLLIGVFDLGVVLGAITGLAAVFFSIVFLTVIFGVGGNHLYFFKANWQIIPVLCTIPFVLSGAITALLKNLIFRPRLL